LFARHPCVQAAEMARMTSSPAQSATPSLLMTHTKTSPSSTDTAASQEATSYTLCVLCGSMA